LKIYISIIAACTFLFITDVSTTNQDYDNFPIKVAGASLVPVRVGKEEGPAGEAKPKTCIEKIKIQQQLIKDSLQDIKENLKTKISP